MSRFFNGQVPSTGAVLKSMQEKLSKRGISFLVIAPPTKVALLKNETAYTWLKRETDRLGIELVPLESRLDPVDFYAKDGHWTASGHAKIAQALAPIIERRRDRATQVPVR